MTKEELIHEVKMYFSDLVQENFGFTDEIHISTKALTPSEAIGETKRKDFPILTGKEVMVQAEFQGAYGQAYTSTPALFHGTLKELFEMDFTEDTHSWGLFIASLNAVMRKLALTDRTVHCKDDGPEECAKLALPILLEKYKGSKIALVGYQPALLEMLSNNFNVRVLDLNPDHIGQTRYGVVVEHGEKDYTPVIHEWADVILCTSSTICNFTIVNYLDLDKEILFYGTSGAGVAKILGLNRLCLAST